MKRKLFYIVPLFFILASCGKPRPQLPANKNIAVDSTKINLRKINETLAVKEDSVIQAMVSKQNVPFKKNAIGIWYYKEKETSRELLTKSASPSVSYTVSTLAGDTLESKKINIRFGKKEIPVGLEEGLKLMRAGEKMRLIVPWYLAYGITGNDNIPAYTSLVYEITSEE